MLSFLIPDILIIRLRELANTLAKTKQMAETLDARELNYIKSNVFVSTIGASTRIENAVLTDAEIDWIDSTLTEDSRTSAFHDQREFILHKLSKDKERSIDEVAGCRAMLHLIFEQGRELFPLKEADIRGLHKELLYHYHEADYHSGGYKQVPNSVVRRIGDEQYPILTTAAPGLETEEAMTSLVAWYNDLLPKHPWSIAVAVEFVFRFLAAHPFQDGNGRLSRALFQLILLQSPDQTLAFLAPYLSIDRHIELKREEYYIVLRRGSEGRFLQDPTQYNYEPFLRFMIKVIEESVEDFDFYRKRYHALSTLSNSARAVLQCFKDQPEIRLQAKNFVETTKLARPTINEALRTLMEKGFIQRYSQGAGTRYQLVF